MKTHRGSSVRPAAEKAQSYYPYTHCRGRSDAPQCTPVQPAAAAQSYYPYSHCGGESSAPQAPVCCEAVPA